MKFLLISPAAAQWRVAAGERAPLDTRIFRFSMLSSLCVAAAAPPGVETRILDEEIEPVDFDADADLVGLSFMTFNAPRAYEIADGFRRKGKPVVMGGYHPTFRPQEAIAHADAPTARRFPSEQAGGLRCLKPPRAASERTSGCRRGGSSRPRSACRVAR